MDLVDRCHRAGRAGARRALDDGDPDGPGGVRALARRCRCSSSSRRSSTASDFVVKRGFDIVGSAVLMVLLSPLMAGGRAGHQAHSRGPVLFRSMRPGIGGRAVRLLQVPHDAPRRGAAGRSELEDHNELGGALFKIRDDPRVTRVGRLLRRWSLDELPQLLQRHARRDVARRPAAAAPARLRPSRGLAPQALPRAARHDRACGRSPAARSSTSTSWCGSTFSTWSVGRCSWTSRS